MLVLDMSDYGLKWVRILGVSTVSDGNIYVETELCYEDGDTTIRDRVSLVDDTNTAIEDLILATFERLFPSANLGIIGDESKLYRDCKIEPTVLLRVEAFTPLDHLALLFNIEMR